jgi:ABC-2 type transport system ATP-binding protein
MLEDKRGGGAATEQAAAVEPALKAERLSKSFGPTAAVDDLTLEARSGEVIGLLGPNGAGKTTTIRMLSTIVPPTQGSFSVCGIPHTRPEEVRRRIGVLPESAGYPQHLTGAEFLTYHARLFGHQSRMAKDLASVLLSEVGLAERAHSLIGTYSRGMRQRLGVARALVNDPGVLFLDEPTLGLDPAGQRQILALIRGVAAERGTAIVLSTHFLDEVEETCSRVVILNRGKVIAEGSVTEIKRIAAPRTAVVRVDPEMHDKARSAIKHAEGIAQVEPAGEATGRFTVTFDAAWLEGQQRGGTNVVLSALSASEVPVLSFELEGGRLSDAFLLLTQGEAQ